MSHEETSMPAESTHLENSPQIASFEEGLGMLGDIVARLESGALGLTESIAAYERGVGLLRRLHDELARADERVSVLVRIDEEGKPVLAPFGSEPGEEDSSDQPGTRRRSRGKASRGRSLPGMDDESPEA
jgi:exodeoxyribonuclease VII small subunit